MTALDQRPLIIHVVYRFDVGGMENGVVNLINHMPSDRYRHMVLALTEVTDFKNRIRIPDVEYASLHKAPGHSLWIYPALVRLFWEKKPAIVHTRNLGPLEVQLAAWLAGVPVRVHGEHGRDVDDLDGHNKKNQWIRRLYAPFVQRFIALSADLEQYLLDRVGISGKKIQKICNGVDADRFILHTEKQFIPGCPWPSTDMSNTFVFGTIGRMHPVKDQVTLVKAFTHLLEEHPDLRPQVRLILVGAGPLQSTVEAMVQESAMEDCVWVAGERNDVPQVLAGIDCFVLPSLAEGISNTILEAMACGKPVIATRVGGTPELVIDQKTGLMVEASDYKGMAQAMAHYVRQPELAVKAGLEGRKRIDEQFSLQAMVRQYQDCYDELRQKSDVNISSSGKK